MKKESWKTVAIVVLAMAGGIAAALAIDLNLRLDLAMHDLAVKTARFDALEKSANLKPVPVIVAEPAPCPVCTEQKILAVQPPISPALVASLARACREGKLGFDGSVTIIKE